MKFQIGDIVSYNCTANCVRSADIGDLLKIIEYDYEDNTYLVKRLSDEKIFKLLEKWIKKPTKQIFSQDDPYGEEEWEMNESKYERGDILTYTGDVYKHRTGKKCRVIAKKTIVNNTFYAVEFLSDGDVRDIAEYNLKSDIPDIPEKDVIKWYSKGKLMREEYLTEDYPAKFSKYFEEEIDFVPFKLREEINPDFKWTDKMGDICYELRGGRGIPVDHEYLNLMKKILIGKHIIFYTYSYVNGERGKCHGTVDFMEFNGHGVLIFHLKEEKQGGPYIAQGALDERMPIKSYKMKQIYTEEDPYGEEDWNVNEKKKVKSRNVRVKKITKKDYAIHGGRGLPFLVKYLKLKLKGKVASFSASAKPGGEESRAGHWWIDDVYLEGYNIHIIGHGFLHTKDSQIDVILSLKDDIEYEELIVKSPEDPYEEEDWDINESAKKSAKNDPLNIKGKSIIFKSTPSSIPSIDAQEISTMLSDLGYRFFQYDEIPHYTTYFSILNAFVPITDPKYIKKYDFCMGQRNPGEGPQITTDEIRKKNRRKISKF
jgi:hypothetical protein